MAAGLRRRTGPGCAARAHARGGGRGDSSHRGPARCLSRTDCPPLAREFDPHRESLDSVHEVAAQVVERADLLHAGYPREQCLEHDADLEPRESVTHAHVRSAAAEGHVLVRVAGDVHAIWISEHLGVTIARGEPGDDLVTLPD